MLAYLCINHPGISPILGLEETETPLFEINEPSIIFPWFDETLGTFVNGKKMNKEAIPMVWTKSLVCIDSIAGLQARSLILYFLVGRSHRGAFIHAQHRNHSWRRSSSKLDVAADINDKDRKLIQVQENIMLSPTNSHAPILCDIGMSRTEAYDGQNSTSIRVPSSEFPRFYAPERPDRQLDLGNYAIRKESDVYSLGMVFLWVGIKLGPIIRRHDARFIQLADSLFAGGQTRGDPATVGQSAIAEFDWLGTDFFNGTHQETKTALRDLILKMTTNNLARRPRADQILEIVKGLNFGEHQS